MTPEERERAERIASRISAECSESDGCFDHDKCTDVLLAFSRKERARVWDEAADRVGPHDDLYFEWRLKAKMLREEAQP